MGEMNRDTLVKLWPIAALASCLALGQAAAQQEDTPMKTTFAPDTANPAAHVEKGEGIVTIPSHHTVDLTVERLKEILVSKGVTLFAVIDHSGEAKKVGMTMPPTKLLIFGNPKGGTPLMLAAPSTAIDLPLKILVWQDADGKVWESYNSPEYLQARHGLPADLLPNIAVEEKLADWAAQ
jgi:uncharacterized protein (DUF302 family)